MRPGDYGSSSSRGRRQEMSHQVYFIRKVLEHLPRLKNGSSRGIGGDEPAGASEN